VPSVRPRLVSFPVNNSLKHPSPQSRQSSKWHRPYHSCAKNEYIDGQFLAGECLVAAVAVDKDRSLMGPMWYLQTPVARRM